MRSTKFKLPLVISFNVNKIFLLFLLLSSALFSQEQPPILSYASDEYLGGSQNWGLSQGNNNYIYVANNSGLLENNGAQWRLYASPNGSVIRSVKAIDDLVYTGCYMEFGYWKRDGYGDLFYTSLVDKLGVSLIDDEQIWNIIEYDIWVIFQSLDRIYIYDTEKETFKIIESTTNRAQIFNVADNIYFQKEGEGLFTIKNGEEKLISGNPIFKMNSVVGVFPKDKKLLVLIENGDFYFIEEANVVQWNLAWKSETPLLKIYTSIQLHDTSFALGTISNGVYHITNNGDFIRNINQENGLNNNTVLSLFQDNEMNLWLGLNNGISVVSTESHFQEYIDRKGRLGVVYAAIIFNGIFYLGTNQGLFYKPVNSTSNFKLIEETKGQVWSLKIINGDLFCGHNSGTFTVNEGSVALVSNLPGTWLVKEIPNRPNLLLQGNYSGLSILEKENAEWSLRNSIEGIDVSSRFVEFLSPFELLVNHEYRGLYSLKLDTIYTKVVASKVNDYQGNGSSMFKYNEDIIYTNSRGVFTLNSTKEFNLDSSLTAVFFNEGDDPKGVFTPDMGAKKIWTFSNTNIIYASPSALEDKLRKHSISIPSSFKRNMGVSGFENITPINSDTYLIGVSNGYITLDLGKVKESAYTIAITSILNDFYDKPSIKIGLADPYTFKYKENDVTFSFSVPEFDKYTEVNYQYKVEGIYDNWSSWSPVGAISFDNLPYGDYSFKVRGKVGNTLTQNTAQFNFKVKRPWYASILALILYGIGVIALSFLIHHLNKHYYRKREQSLISQNRKALKRKKLKAQKKIVQVNNERLKNEIESKNRELAVSTMSLIKKNEFLNAIKDQLKNAPESTAVKSVIQTIDRSINNADDWKFFEKAFNNADKDFLKRIKSAHSELTPNDLKLCAYLRLNLSSKEIAPLLNISTRSVEVKRYRLRKKMNLQREESLTTYILDL